jgi:selenocysteine-specific elongation factor
MKHIIIGTAGHIDHGKTSLIRMLTGFDCDTHKEEKARGITINLGFTHIELPSGESAGIVDVPGHKDFIHTMVSGACGIDLVLLVIACDSGIMPQTAEHINIITALGVDKGIVVLTKTDLVDEEMVELAKFEITEYLKNSTLKNAPVIGISAVTGSGREELTETIDTLISTIRAKENGNLFRMYIDRIFTVKGFGSVATGSVLGGSVSIGNELFLLPGDKQKLRVRTIERHGKSVEKVERGDRAAINLIGLKHEDFERGMLISDKQLESIMMVDAYISLFEQSPSIGIWSDVIFLSGTFESTAKMHLLNKDSVSGGRDGIVQILLQKPAVLLNRDRFIIRNSSATLTMGGGYVIDASPLHHRKRTTQLTETLEKLCLSVLTDNSAAEDIRMLLTRDFRPFNIDEIIVKLNATKEEIISELAQQQEDIIVYNNGNLICISEKCENIYKDKILKSLQEFHNQNSLSSYGLESGELLGKLGLSKYRSGKIYLELLLSKMKGEHAIERFENTWIISGYKPSFDEKTMKQIALTEEIILTFEDELPSLSVIEEKAAENGLPKQKLKQLLSYLQSTGKIKYLKEDFVHAHIAGKFRNILLKALIDKPGGIGIAEYKIIVPCTKRMRAFLGEIYESEKLIQFHYGQNIETRIEITQQGKDFIKQFQNP